MVYTQFETDIVPIPSALGFQIFISKLKIISNDLNMLCTSWNQLVLDLFYKFILIKTRYQNYLRSMIHTIPFSRVVFQKFKKFQNLPSIDGSYIQNFLLKGLLGVTSMKNAKVCLKSIVSFS